MTFDKGETVSAMLVVVLSVGTHHLQDGQDQLVVKQATARKI